MPHAQINGHSFGPELEDKRQKYQVEKWVESATTFLHALSNCENEWSARPTIWHARNEYIVEIEEEGRKPWEYGYGGVTIHGEEKAQMVCDWINEIDLDDLVKLIPEPTN